MRRCIAFALGLWLAGAVHAQNLPDRGTTLQRLAEASGVAGYETEVKDLLLSLLPPDVSPTVDEMGNILVTLGDGKPYTVVITHYDEMGYVVTRITEDGLLRVSRMGTVPESPFFDLFHEGQLLQLLTPGGKLPAAVAVTSLHLRGARPEHFGPEDIWVDVGAESPEGAADMGVDLLQPLHIFKDVRKLGAHRVAGPSIGDRFGALAMMGALKRLDRGRLAGTVTFAWTVQGTLLGRGYGSGGMTGRGARRVAEALSAANSEPDKVLVVDRFVPARSPDRSLILPTGDLGKGALISATDDSTYDAGLANRALEVARQLGRAAQTSSCGGANAAGGFESGAVQKLALGVPLRYSGSHVEMIDLRDLDSLIDLIGGLLQ